MKEYSELILARYKGRTSAYAEKRNGEYFTKREDNIDLPLMREDIISHLKGEVCLGVYLIAPETSEVSFSVLDIDNHGGELSWDEVVEKTLPLVGELKKHGVFPFSVRSSGGQGVHVNLFWETPQKATDVRLFLSEVLKSCGYSEGSEGGIQAEKVEIFPKQDRVQREGYGNLIALPFSGESVPLDENLDPLNIDKAFDCLKNAKFSPNVPRCNSLTSESETVQMENNGNVENLRAKCLFIHHCREESATLSEPLWHAAAANLALVDGGDELFHELSHPHPQYTHIEADKKLNKARKATSPHTCKTIERLGYPCSNMNDEGRCFHEGVRAPVGLSLNRDELIQIFSQKGNLTKPQKLFLSNLIRDDLCGKGKFYHVKDTHDLYYFYNPEKKLYLIGSMEFRALCNELYIINGTEQVWSFFEEEMITYCHRNGQPTEIFQLSRFQNGKLYIHFGGHSVFRLDGEQIESINNGDDGVLFIQDEKMEPVEPKYEYEGSPVRELLVDIVNVADDGDSENCRDLYHAFIYSIFLESILPTKPIVLFHGVKGSGKTSAGRALKRTLFGVSGQVDTGLTDKEDAFWAGICNSYLLCIDNVDTLVRWLADALAVVSTGGTLKRRKLYETNTLVEYTPRCFVMLTSRNPSSFRRDDVIDRLLLIEVERRQKFKEESVLLEELDLKRGEIIGELLTKLNQIVFVLNKNEKGPVLPFRLADWASLVIKMSPILGIENPMKKLQALEISKQDFALEENLIVSALDEMISGDDVFGPFSSGDLFKKVLTHYDNSGIKFWIREPRMFGSELKNLIPALEKIYNITIEKGPSNTKIYSFIRKTPTYIEAEGIPY